ncbi:DNA circularization N-terminal domain-containing protein [Methylophilus sp. DW102]|uniref:DNA circularization protein n=1 Tax=Methylophilus sp. DW102 TaxID=3095607 RepID=UPI00308D20E5|nr:DNA circularization N-terminal domain-containing protein [Methylophilus sp. DW102]
MSWMERLNRGTWKNRDFLTENHNASFGRRLVIHEYPNRDDAEVEDLGAMAKGWQINAYFIGPNYDIEADEFLNVLAEPGADWLMHPYLGEIWVRPWKWTRSEQVGEDGYCKFSITFAPGGRQPFEPTVDKVDRASAAIEDAQDKIKDNFELQPMTGSVFDDLVADVQSKLDVMRKAIAMATLPLSKSNQVLTIINGIKTDVRTLLGLPQQYANTLASFANVLAFLDSPDDDLTVPVRVRAVTRLTSTVNNPPAFASNSTQTAALIANNAAEQDLRNQLLLTSAAGLAITTYQDAETRDRVLQALLDGIDSVLNNAKPDVFNALLDMRAALIDALLDQDLSNYQTKQVVNFMPACVLAHQLDIIEADFVQLNGVAHPLFVAGTVRG